MYQTPSYIKQVIMPKARQAKTSRRIWSIDLETVWLPFFTATNAQGDTAMPSEALGAPLRLATAKDGSIRFTDSGTPVIRVVKDIGDAVRSIREQFTAGLMAFTHGVATENAEAYKSEAIKAVEAGKPIIARDTAKLVTYQRMKAEAEAEPEPEAVKPRIPELVSA